MIKSKPGNFTPGADKETLDGINSKYFTDTREKLRAGKFEFKPGRRVEIPKLGRKITVGAPREKIVQKAFQLVMEQYYEPKMSEYSYGFRPNRSLRTAILRIDSDFQSSR